MGRTIKLKILFALLGASSGALGLLMIRSIVEPEDFSLVIGIPFEIALSFPLIAAGCALLAIKGFNSRNFGLPQGAAAAVIAFLYFATLHGALSAVCSLFHFRDISALLVGPAIMLADLTFGVFIMGIPILIIGAAGGAYFKSYVQ